MNNINRSDQTSNFTNCLNFTPESNISSHINPSNINNNHKKMSEIDKIFHDKNTIMEESEIDDYNHLKDLLGDNISNVNNSSTWANQKNELLSQITEIK